jgi:alanine dehydrogenase
VVDGIVHYCVTNMPGAVGRTSTYALCNVTLPYVLRLANQGLEKLTTADRGFAHAVNLHAGTVTNEAVATTFGLPWKPFGG